MQLIWMLTEKAGHGQGHSHASGRNYYYGDCVCKLFTTCLVSAHIKLCTAQDDNMRTKFTTPRGPYIAKLETRHLAINGLREVLSIRSDWGAHAMDDFFRQLFPEYFTYMDKYHPLDTTAVPPHFQWTCLIRSHLSLSASPHTSPDAKQMSRYFMGSNGKVMQRKIFLGTSYISLSFQCVTNPNFCCSFAVCYPK